MLCQAVMAQRELTVNDCMRYAVEHNHDVRISRLTQDSRQAERTAAIGAFLPSIGASIGAQYNFGRAIDPETNTYTNVNTFYNGYSVSASLPVFDGFQRLNQLRASKAAIQMGRSQLQAQQDELALQVFEAYCNVLYYKGTRAMAEEKRQADSLTLRQTQVMCEIGQKSEADVAQMEAQLAADEYEVTRQESELAKRKLELIQLMGGPSPLPLPCREGSSYHQEDEFELKPIDVNDTQPSRVYTPLPTREGQGGGSAVGVSALLSPAIHNVTVARYKYREARSAFYPSLSLGAGINTTYNKMLHTPATAFKDQLRNNRGEYVYATLSIPLFNRLQNITNLRRQRNNLRIAEEQLAQKRDELTKLQLQATNDCEGYHKQTHQMQRKVTADSLAYQLTLRKYEEGLSSSIDVQTTSATLLQSKAQLLQCQLMWALKQKLVGYYQGEPLLSSRSEEASKSRNTEMSK